MWPCFPGADQMAALGTSEPANLEAGPDTPEAQPPHPPEGASQAGNWEDSCKATPGASCRTRHKLTPLTPGPLLFSLAPLTHSQG